MKPEKTVDYLCRLRDKIAALSVVKCCMSHERINRAGKPLLPVVSRLPGISYQRVGLCSPEVRAQRLGCSHTTARIILEDAIDELGRVVEEGGGQISLIGSDLNWLNNQIHLLDHSKGEAEIVVAKAEEELAGKDAHEQGEEILIRAKQSVFEMERLHDKYVEQLGDLRDRVVNELDKLIQMTTRESANARKSSGIDLRGG